MARILEPTDEAAMNGSRHEDAPAPEAAGRSPRRLPSEAIADEGFWTRAAAKRLREGSLDADAAWDAYWRKRESAAAVGRLVHSLGTPLAWGVDLASLSEECRAIVDLADDLDRGAPGDKLAKGKRIVRIRESVALWLETARDGDTDVCFSVGCLAATHVLHRLGRDLGPDDGWTLLDFLYATAEDARPWEASPERSANNTLAQQLVAGELPLTLAYLFPEMAPLAALARPARKRLAAGLATLVGDVGMVRASHLSVLPGLTACWTRCYAMSAQLEKGAWNDATEQQFRAVVRQAIRWTDSHGQLLLASNDTPAWSPDFLAAAVRASDRPSDAAAARVHFAGAKLAAEVPLAKAKLPRPSTFAEEAGLALLRASWEPGAASVAIDFSNIGMRLSAYAEGRQLFDGVWTASSRIDGKLLKPAGPWDAVCWFTDKDVDYVEFRMPLDGDAWLERQVLLARKDGFLFLADHLQNTERATLEHTWQLPLADGLAWHGADETREAVISADRGLIRVLPIALPEWRVDPRMGELTCADGALRLDQRTIARAVACPVFLDLTPRRHDKPCTWRQLTVAEALQVQPPDVAVGYRVQCGRKQWLIYRSQAPRGNRTVLGQNTSSEFLAARFLSPSGEIEQLVQVEG